MAETWISRPELEEVLGRDGADLLCRVSGGVPVYVPLKADVSTHLGRILGPFKLAALARVYGGMRITVPNGRKAEAHKNTIIGKLEAGLPYDKIALELGVTERYVRMVAQACRAPTTRQLSFFDPPA